MTTNEEDRRMSVDGTWNVKMETPMGTRAATLTLKADGASLSGTMGGPEGSTSIYDGTANGNSVGWKTDITSPMPLTLEFSATVEGDSISGSVKLGMFGNAPLSGTRG
jgi:hypothetical protein